MLQRCLTSISATAHVKLSADGRRASAQDEAPHGALVDRGRPVSLLGEERLRLLAGWRYRVIQDGAGWRVSTAGCRYRVERADGTEYFSYHWHPDGESRNPEPHLHLGHAALRQEAVMLERAHLPTRRVAFEDVLLLLLCDARVVPARADAVELLTRSRDEYRNSRSWT